MPGGFRAERDIIRTEDVSEFGVKTKSFSSLVLLPPPALPGPSRKAAKQHNTSTGSIKSLIMATPTPETFRAWQYTTRNKPFESNLKLNTIPMLKPPTSGHTDKSLSILVKVHAAALNPADYKVPTTPVLGFLMVKPPATPGLDYSGVIADIPAELSVKYGLKVGGRVIGRLNSLYQHGTLAEYVLGSANGLVKLPENASFEQGAALSTAGLTGLQPLFHIAPGANVFINGGSGGVGSFTTQIAKLLGAGHVTVTCGPTNVERVRGLGADEVVNYQEKDVLSTLKEGGREYDVIIENVGNTDTLYENCHHFLKPGGKFIQVAGTNMLLVAKRLLLPTILGGGQRKFEFYLTSNDTAQLGRLAGWLGEGKLKTEIDEVVPFEEVVRAYEKLAGGRAKGKIVVKVVE